MGQSGCMAPNQPWDSHDSRGAHRHAGWKLELRIKDFRALYRARLKGGGGSIVSTCGRGLLRAANPTNSTAPPMNIIGSTAMLLFVSAGRPRSQDDGQGSKGPPYDLIVAFCRYDQLHRRERFQTYPGIAVGILCNSEETTSG